MLRQLSDTEYFLYIKISEFYCQGRNIRYETTSEIQVPLLEPPNTLQQYLANVLKDKRRQCQLSPALVLASGPKKICPLGQISDFFIPFLNARVQNQFKDK
jgi:hypothetical protein